jgi:hypothetical protein
MPQLICVRLPPPQRAERARGSTVIRCGIMSGTLHNVARCYLAGEKQELETAMRRLQNNYPPDEIADMLAAPPLGLEGFDDPIVCCRIGECISQAMHQPIRRIRKRRVADVRIPRRHR